MKLKTIYEQMVWTPGGGENGVEPTFPPEESPTSPDNKIHESSDDDVFDKIYAEFDSKDYFAKKLYYHTLSDNNRRAGNKYTDAQIKDFVDKKMYDGCREQFNKMKISINTKNVQWLKANVRPSQKFLSKCFEEITGINLGTNEKSYARAFDSLKTLKEETMQGEGERADINLANKFAKMLGEKIKVYYEKTYDKYTPEMIAQQLPKVKPGVKFIKIDAQGSGKFMLGPGNRLYFIKGYGTPDLKKDFGNIADIIKSDFDFDGYSIVKKGSGVHSKYGYAGPIAEENVALPIVRKKINWNERLKKMKKRRGEGMDDRASGYFMERLGEMWGITEEDVKKAMKEAITPEERKVEADFGSILKKTLKNNSMLTSVADKIRITVVPSQRPNTWIQMWVPFGSIISNEFRVKIAKALGLTGVLKWDNVNYGNIRDNGISLKYSEWKKLMDNGVLN